jgi:hypothetical protein
VQWHQMSWTMVELQILVRIIPFRNILIDTCHSTDLPEPAVVYCEVTSLMKSAGVKHTNTMKPDEGV